MSGVRSIYEIFASKIWAATDYTREKNNSAWSEFWFLLISAGFRFVKTDLLNLGEFCQQDNSPVWHPPGEGHYARAVRDGNISFAIAYETYKGRKPFIFSGIDYGRYHGGDYVRHRTRAKRKGRIVLRAKFLWRDETVTVTSFVDSRRALVACSYYPCEKGHEPSRIRKRFCITVEDLHKERLRLKKGGCCGL